MTETTGGRLLRLFAVILAPAVSTFTAWWLFLGFDRDDNYAVSQCVGLVVVLVAVGVAAAWPARRRERGMVIVSAGAGISVGCFTAWMDDETGMFVVGWMMLTPVAFLGTALVVGATGWVKDRFRRPSGSTGPATRQVG